MGYEDGESVQEGYPYPPYTESMTTIAKTQRCAPTYLLALLAELLPHLPKLLANLLRHNSGPYRQILFQANIHGNRMQAQGQ